MVVVEGATEVVVWGATVLGDEVSAEAWVVVEAWVVEEAWVLVVVVGAPAQARLLPNTATATSAKPSMTGRPELNRCSGFCRPVPSHSATSPEDKKWSG